MSYEGEGRHDFDAIDWVQYLNDALEPTGSAHISKDSIDPDEVAYLGTMFGFVFTEVDDYSYEITKL